MYGKVTPNILDKMAEPLFLNEICLELFSEASVGAASSQMQLNSFLLPELVLSQVWNPSKQITDVVKGNFTRAWDYLHRKTHKLVALKSPPEHLYINFLLATTKHWVLIDITSTYYIIYDSLPPTKARTKSA